MSAIESPAVPDAGEPTAAELVRSVLAAARSLTVATDHHRVELAGLHSVEPSGGLLLAVPAETHLSGEIAAAPYGGLPATVELTDVAPVSVPDRIRARVLLTGRLTLAGDISGPVTFEPSAAELVRNGRRVHVDRGELARAEPDPLAETEAEILTHLAGAHGDAVELLSQLVDARLLIGVTRVDPLRLDRYGIVLRLQRSGALHDVRLGFPARLRNPAHGVVQLRSLLARARTCPRHRSRR